MSRHTPGPWKLEQSDDPRDFIVTEPSGRTVCEPNDPLYDCEPEEGERRISLEEALANARLIAAAPQLLEALQDIACQLTGLEGRQYKWIRDRALAAISLAERGAE